MGLHSSLVQHRQPCDWRVTKISVGGSPQHVVGVEMERVSSKKERVKKHQKTLRILRNQTIRLDEVAFASLEGAGPSFVRCSKVRGKNQNNTEEAT